jgi:hypothetical protein
MKAVPVVLSLLVLLGANSAPKAVDPHQLKVTVSGLS